MQRSLSRQVRRSRQGWTASFVVLAALLVGCGSPTPSGPAAARAQGAMSAGSPSASTSTSPAADRVPLTRPSWLPDGVPMPDGARITSVSAEGGCQVTWLLSGADLQATAAEIVSAAKKAGLSVRVTASTTHVAPEPSLTDGLLGDVGDAGSVQGPVMIARVGMTMSHTQGHAVDLGLSGLAGGVVMGDYELAASACAG